MKLRFDKVTCPECGAGHARHGMGECRDLRLLRDMDPEEFEFAAHVPDDFCTGFEPEWADRYPGPDGPRIPWSRPFRATCSHCGWAGIIRPEQRMVLQ